MSTFGSIKTKLEEAASSLYGKPSFKTFMQNFKNLVLENKDISEIYFIYDDLNSNKGLDRDIADDYINESIEYCQILIESNSSKINNIDSWLNKFVKTNKNNYKNIENTVYLNSIKDLEVVLESKKQIKKVLTENTKKEEVVTENYNLPISTMVSIANKKLSEEFSNLNESDKNELKQIVSLSSNDLKKEVNGLKEDIVSKLKNKINESSEKDLELTITETINKVMESKVDHYNLYKLRKLNEGL
jgi:F0F1-type ATP synthase membrane subunit b/b'